MPIPVFTSRIVTDSTWTVQVQGGSLQTFASTQYYHLLTAKSSTGNGQSFIHALKLLLDASSGLTWTATLDSNLKLKLTHDSGSSQSIDVPAYLAAGLGFTAGLSWSTAGGEEEPTGTAVVAVPAGAAGNTAASRPWWLWCPEMPVSGVGPEQFDPAYTAGIRSSAGASLRAPDGSVSHVSNGMQIEAEFVFNGVQPYKRAYRPPFTEAVFNDDFATWWRRGPKDGRSVLFWRNKNDLIGTALPTNATWSPHKYVEYEVSDALRSRPSIRATVPGNPNYHDISIPLWLGKNGEAVYA